MKKQGGWIFISHSHNDIDVVRKIRNRFEEHGYDPLLFYLKCLSDDCEIENLIKREIDEREWFVYVDSPNARASKWVCSEREYIASLPDKKILTIDAAGDIIEQADRIINHLKIFISYTRRNAPLISRISKALTDKDFLVLTEADTLSCGSWDVDIYGKIQETARSGFVLVAVDEDGASSEMVKYEVNAAMAAGASIIPIFVGDIDTKTLPKYLMQYSGFFIDREPSDEQLSTLASDIAKLVPYRKA